MELIPLGNDLFIIVEERGGCKGKKGTRLCLPDLKKMKPLGRSSGRSEKDLKKKGQRRSKKRRGRSLVFQAPTGQVGFKGSRKRPKNVT